MNAPHQGGEKAPAVRLPVRLKSGGARTPERPQVVSTDAGLLDLESKWHALQGVIRGIGDNMRGESFEQGVATPILEERLAATDGEILVLEARIAEAEAEGLVGVGVKLRLADFYRDPDLRDEAQHQACVQTALEAVERLLITGKNGG